MKQHLVQIVQHLKTRKGSYNKKNENYFIKFKMLIMEFSVTHNNYRKLIIRNLKESKLPEIKKVDLIKKYISIYI